jgi:hypothetical protein
VQTTTLQNRLKDYSYGFNGMETDKEVSGTPDGDKNPDKRVPGDFNEIDLPEFEDESHDFTGVIITEKSEKMDHGSPFAGQDQKTVTTSTFIEGKKVKETAEYFLDGVSVGTIEEHDLTK